MRRIFVPALAAAAALTACSASTSATAQATAPKSRTLVVTGQGEASAAPDLLTLTIGVETQADTATNALRQNNAQMQATIDRLKKSGVADKDMQTSNLSVNPRYNYEENRSSPKIIGYSANNMLTVKLRDVAGAGDLIDKAVSDGANNLGGISFGFADDKPLMAKARENAVEDAKEKAAALARAAGVSLGPIIQIQDGYVSGPPMPYMEARAMAMDAKGAPIAAGESTMTASVTLIYEIR